MTPRNMRPAVGRLPYRVLLEPNETCITDVDASILSLCRNPETERSLASAMGHPEAMVRVYRALPVGIFALNEGDFVGLDWACADRHAENCEDGQGWKFHIITALVPAKNVFMGEYGPYHFGYLGDTIRCDAYTGGAVGTPYEGEAINAGDWVSVKSDNDWGRFWTRALGSGDTHVDLVDFTISFPLSRITHHQPA